MKLTVYAFEDGDGQEFGTFTTQDYPEAKSYAIRNGLRIVARNFEYSDAEHLDDYTKADDPFDEEDEADGNG